MLPAARIAWLALALGGGACAAEVRAPNGSGGPGGSGPGALGGGGGGGVSVSDAGPSYGGACQNLECQQSSCRVGSCRQQACAAGATTTVSGTVYDPAGKVPLYNAIVYVPNSALDPIAEGVSCDKCAGTASGHPISSALTDAAGNFVLPDVPVGTDIPLVIQIGKWRRQTAIPTVTACTNTQLTDPSLTRLPRDQTEGHLPQMAITTGHSDALECLLRKMGVSDQEFSTNAGTGRVHMYVGCDGGNGFGCNQLSADLGGATFPAATTLWSDATLLAKYDILLLSCEGSQCGTDKKPYVGLIKAYADMGGRLFLDHLHYYWLRNGALPWPTSANYIGSGADLPSPFTVDIDASFPKGASFSEWLVNVGAAPAPAGTPPGPVQLSILGGQYSVESAIPPMTQQWIYTDMNPDTSSGGMGVEYMTMNTPVEKASTDPGSQCGRVVFTDLHVVSATGDVSRAAMPFPTGCVVADLTPQEKALEFMFFDLSSCVQPENEPPPPIMIGGIW
jgi:hypothetical protein